MLGWILRHSTNQNSWSDVFGRYSHLCPYWHKWLYCYLLVGLLGEIGVCSKFEVNLLRQFLDNVSHEGMQLQPLLPILSKRGCVHYQYLDKVGMSVRKRQFIESGHTVDELAISVMGYFWHLVVPVPEHLPKARDVYRHCFRGIWRLSQLSGVTAVTDKVPFKPRYCIWLYFGELKAISQRWGKGRACDFEWR